MATFKNKLDDALGDAFGTRPKRNNAPGAAGAGRSGGGRRGGGRLQAAGRIAAKTPEVMVRVSGSARGARHTREHLNYITRNGKLEAETDTGDTLRGPEAVRALAGSWSTGDNGRRGQNSRDRRQNSKDTVNLVLSMPPGTDRDKLKDAVRNFAGRNFAADREYAFVRHDDTKHPHCHLTLKAVGHDGRRLNPKKADLQAWREDFAACLQEKGVAAAASARRTRGVTQKGKRQAVIHAEKRGQSTVAKAKVDQAAKRAGQGGATAQPWEKALEARQERVRGGWLKAAKVLEASGQTGSQRLAGQMRRFVKSMPAVETEQQALVKTMQAAVAGKARTQRASTTKDQERDGPER